jgi:hypothetical protein
MDKRAGLEKIADKRSGLADKNERSGSEKIGARSRLVDADARSGLESFDSAGSAKFGQSITDIDRDLSTTRTTS